MATAPHIPEFPRNPAPWQPGRVKTGSPALLDARLSPDAEAARCGFGEKTEAAGVQQSEGRRGAKGEARGAQRRYLDTTSNNSQSLKIQGSTEDYFEKVIRPVLVQSLQRCGRDGEARAFATCGKYFDVWLKGDAAKLVPCPCNSPFCPDCANRRSAPLQKKLAGMVNRPGRSYWFLTLTVPNLANITKWDIQQIAKFFGELWESWVFQEFEGPDGKPLKIHGGVRSIECVWNRKANSWHPHIHVLLECPKVLPDWWLVLVKAKWLELTGDGRYVHLIPAYYMTKDGKKKKKRLNRKALREVCKYVTKSATFASDHLLVNEFLTAFKGIRRVQFFGAYFGKAAKEFERQPGEDDAGIAETKQKLREEGYERIPFKAHISDTWLAEDGSRQLTFEFMRRVRAYVEDRDLEAGSQPEFELQHPPTSDGQRELEMNPGWFVEQSASQMGIAF